MTPRDRRDSALTILVSVLAGLMMVGVGSVAVLVVGCYPRPPVNPPTCAQDPTQDWCVPPPFQAARDGGGQ